jgi:serine/threonine protein kinase
MSMAVDQSLNLKPGMIVQGKYEILRCLGAGSMGMVYAVKHLDLQGRVLALKVLFSDVAKDEVQAARFKNEIVASYEVNHPHVVRAYDYFRENNMIAYTMEYVSGGDLADRLGEDELLSIDDILLMLRQMASGVQAIHQAGIIHRDLKPENILLSEQGDVKITDFGIARNLKGPRLTDHGGIVGTFAYVSPEYLEHGKVDVRSDIYSLGVLAYEMITGVPPYSAKNIVEEMHLRLTTDPAPPVHLRKDCPIILSNAILQALSRDPSTRFSSAKEFYDMLSSVGKEKLERSGSVKIVEDDFSKQVSSPNVSPKILDSQVDLMLKGLKDSLEDREYPRDFQNNDHGNIQDIEVDRSDFNLYESDTDKSVSWAYPVGVSSGSLSSDRIKELEKGLKSRTLIFPEEMVGTRSLWHKSIAGIFSVLSGFLIGFIVIRLMFPGMYEEARLFILESINVVLSMG